MKKHIPLMALARLALALVMCVGTVVRGATGLFQTLAVWFSAADRAMMTAYYGIIARVDKIVNGKSHYAN